MYAVRIQAQVDTHTKVPESKSNVATGADCLVTQRNPPIRFTSPTVSGYQERDAPAISQVTWAA